MNITSMNYLLILFPLLMIAVVFDVQFQKIPNWLTLSSITLGFGYHTALYGPQGFLFSMYGFIIGLLTLAGFYSAGGMGAGDVKLMGAVGSLLGPKWVFVAFLLTGISGGIYAVMLLALRGCLKETAVRYWMMMKTLIVTRRIFYIPPELVASKLRLRYGLAIALGTSGSVFLKTFNLNIF